MSALVVVDVQNDFTTGALSLASAPSRADIGATIANINSLLTDQHFDIVVYTMDYHPDDHCSFVKWPKHCVAGTWGAQFDQRLIDKPPKCGTYFTVRKGDNKHVDSYSAFIDNERKEETELRERLLENKINNVYVCGLALDYCVFHTALDSAEYGFKTSVVTDCCAAYQTMDHPECKQKMDVLRKAGVKFVDSQHL